jgi:hypothetical protein
MRGISLNKAYEASLAIFLAALLVSLRWESLAVSLGLASGTALAMGLIRSWQLLVERALDPARDRASGARLGKAVLFGLLKLPALGAIVYVLVGREWVDPIAFAAGVAIPQLALALLALGARLLGSEGGAQPARDGAEGGAGPRAPSAARTVEPTEA